MMKTCVRALLTTLVVLPFSACNRDSSEPEPTRTVRFTTDEGTWMSVDVSPDGKTIAFDLLGRIYTVPIAGGQATPLFCDEPEWDQWSRYSPDGNRMALLRDREGVAGLWVVDVPTGQPRRLTDVMQHGPGDEGVGRVGCAPEWTGKGDEIAFRLKGWSEGLRIASVTGGERLWLDSA